MIYTFFFLGQVGNEFAVQHYRKSVDKVYQVKMINLEAKLSRFKSTLPLLNRRLQTTIVWFQYTLVAFLKVIIAIEGLCRKL